MCFELLAAAGAFDVFISTDTELTANLHSRVDAALFERTYSVRLLYPNKAAIQATGDKAAFARWMMAHNRGQNIPRVFDDLSSLTLPVLVKPSVSAFGKGIEVCRTVECVQNATQALQARQAGYIIQELVPGTTEYTVHFTAKQGQLLDEFLVCYKFPHDQFVVRGHLVQDYDGTETIDCSLMNQMSGTIDLVRGMLKDLEYEGLGCVDLRLVFEDALGGEVIVPDKRSSSGDRAKDATRRAARAVLFELNARPCGSFVAVHSKKLPAIIERLFGQPLQRQI